VHEGRLHVLHDDRRHAHVLRLLLLVASIDRSKVSSSVRNTAPHHRGFAVAVVRPIFHACLLRPSCAKRDRSQNDAYI
jgi:hypothetical protein